MSILSGKCAELKRGAWAVHDLLTDEECVYLQRNAEASGMHELSGPLRQCTRAELHEPELAAAMWQRMRPHVPARVHVDSSCPDGLGLPAHDEALHGIWEAVGLNPHMRIVKYAGDGQGHFGPHRDAAYEPSRHERSLLTVNGYLNALPPGVGGATRLLRNDLPIHKDREGRLAIRSPEEDVEASFRPDEAGCGLIFYHGLMHDGEPLAEGAPPKWLFRTEVMYRRDPASAPPSSAAEDEARALELEAEDIECHDPMRAVDLYRRADRLRKGLVAPHGSGDRAGPAPASLLGSDPESVGGRPGAAGEQAAVVSCDSDPAGTAVPLPGADLRGDDDRSWHAGGAGGTAHMVCGGVNIAASEVNDDSDTESWRSTGSVD
mmetsp:Transcript_13626/g.33056  ORF Transcript_13626/g.33056 Transcript_13626/m.33056 type:complete len:377 (-) Transcript_13626:147-1277(-)